MTTTPIDAIIHHKGNIAWAIAPDASVLAALRVMAEKNVGALLVMDGDRLVGVISERDYARKVALKGRTSRDTLVRDIVSTPPITAAPHNTIEECMRLMTTNRVRHLPVLKDGRVTGVVSIGDLVNWVISTQQETINQMENYIAGGYR